MHFSDRDLPKCCQNCQHLGSDWNEYSDETTWYCPLNIIWPHRKQTCRKQKPYAKVYGEDNTKAKTP